MEISQIDIMNELVEETIEPIKELLEETIKPLIQYRANVEKRIGNKEISEMYKLEGEAK